MKIGILQIDGGRYLDVPYPNLALMKISYYFKDKGDEVSWYEGELFAPTYDKIYASKIFNYSKMPTIPLNMVVGGTGIDFENKLPYEIENSPVDWEIYPNIPFHLGFTMKGCRFSCKFCCVPKKEGKAFVYNGIEEILTNPSGGKNLMLLDNDFFGGANWRENIEAIKSLKLKVCFSQGINIRIITEEQAKLLSSVNYFNPKFKNKYLNFAWDRFKDEKIILKQIDRCINAGIPPHHMQFYVLIGFDTTPEQDYYRVDILRKFGCKPFVMPYKKDDPYQKAFARYVNNRIIFNSCSWNDYKYNKFKKTI